MVTCKSSTFGGVDLVIELPVCYALNAAPNFATGGINILNALGVVNNICFGSESGSIDELMSAAELLENENSEISEKIKKYVMGGMIIQPRSQKHIPHLSRQIYCLSQTTFLQRNIFVH